MEDLQFIINMIRYISKVSLKKKKIKMQEISQIQSLIYTVRGYRVMLDSDLASLYEVETRVLNQAVKRNI